MYYQVGAQPGTVLLFTVGVLTFLGLVRAGRIVCRLASLDAPEPWETTIAALAGTLVVSLLAESVAMSLLVPAHGWAAGWWVLAAAGLWEGCRLAAAARSFDWPWAFRNPFVLAAAVANAVTLLIALAPSSKIDELHYHMLAARRILSDGSLRFYCYPWQSAILPQMHYQLAEVLPQAVGAADAPNVTSWCFGVLLQVFVARLIVGAGAPAGAGAAAAACAAVGIIPAVWHVTAGAHAMGHLASASLIVLATPGAPGRRLCSLNGLRRVLACSLLAVAAVATKLTLFPLAGACLLWVVCGWLREGAARGSFGRMVATAVLPWAVLYAPLAVYTAAVSGSPFAVVLPGSTGPSAYEPGEAAELLRRTREQNQAGVTDFLFYTGVNYSPALWLAAVGVLLAPAETTVRLYWATVTAVSFGVILLVTQNDIRFVAGYPYAALVLLAAVAPAEWWGWISRHRRLAGVVASGFVVPWLAGMTYYAIPFARCSLGIESREEFVRRYTAFRDDFVRLNDVLPGDAVLLVAGVRLNSANAPRPVVFDVRDLPPDRPAYLFAVNDAAPPGGPYAIGNAVYDNPNAIIAAYRKPGALPLLGAVRVCPMHPAAADDRK
jgi:hypothetical protein